MLYLHTTPHHTTQRVFPHLVTERTRGDVRQQVIGDLHLATLGRQRFLAISGRYDASPCASPETRWFDGEGWAWAPVAGAPGQWQRTPERLVRALRRALRAGDVDALVEARSRHYEAPFETREAAPAAGAELAGALLDVQGVVCEPGPAAAAWMAGARLPLPTPDEHEPSRSHFELLVADTSTDFEWRHIDGLFEQAFMTLPDYRM